MNLTCQGTQQAHRGAEAHIVVAHLLMAETSVSQCFNVLKEQQMRDLETEKLLMCIILELELAKC